MELHLFFIFVLINIMVVEKEDGGLTNLKEPNSSMPSMLLFEETSEEKGLRPQRAAPREEEDKEQKQEDEENWDPTGVAPQFECEKCDPKMGKYIRSSLVKSNEIDPSLVICLQPSQLALVGLKPSLPVTLYQALGHLKPDSQ